MNGNLPIRRWDRVIPLLQEFESYLSPKTPTLEIENANDIQWSQEEYLRTEAREQTYEGKWRLSDLRRRRRASICRVGDEHIR